MTFQRHSWSEEDRQWFRPVLVHLSRLQLERLDALGFHPLFDPTTRALVEEVGMEVALTNTDGAPLALRALRRPRST